MSSAASNSNSISSSSGSSCFSCCFLFRVHEILFLFLFAVVSFHLLNDMNYNVIEPIPPYSSFSISSSATI